MRQGALTDSGARLAVSKHQQGCLCTIHPPGVGVCLCVHRNVQPAMAVYKGAGIWNQVFMLVQQALNCILSLQMVFFLKMEARMWSIKQGCCGEEQGGSSKRPGTEVPCGSAQQSHGAVARCSNPTELWLGAAIPRLRNIQPQEPKASSTSRLAATL